MQRVSSAPVAASGGASIGIEGEITLRSC